MLAYADPIPAPGLPGPRVPSGGTPVPAARPAPTILLAAPPAGVAPLRVEGRDGNRHDRASRAVLLGRIAALLDVPLAGPATLAEARAADLLLVPGDALVAPAGTLGPDRLLGGLVPAPFVSTKAIAHGLVAPDAARPARWDAGLAARLDGAVLRGVTAFTRADALRAGERLLAIGPVRLKDTCGKAGLGQEVVADRAALAAALGEQDDDALAEHGLVLEENLTDVVTYSVGATTLGEHRVAYWGTQALTRDHQGREVYGGSDLRVVRGDLDALARRDLPAEVAVAVRGAARFDAVVRAAYPEAVLTRRNYDVIRGRDAAGRERVAVLEQSWRIGGASGAELAAMEALRDLPTDATVRCETVEVYGDAAPPAGAVTYFAGHDPAVGPMLKYARRVA